MPNQKVKEKIFTFNICVLASAVLNSSTSTTGFQVSRPAFK